MGVMTCMPTSCRRLSVCLPVVSSASGSSRIIRVSDDAMSLKGIPTASLHPSERYSFSGCFKASRVTAVNTDPSLQSTSQPRPIGHSRVCSMQYTLSLSACKLVEHMMTTERQCPRRVRRGGCSIGISMSASVRRRVRLHSPNRCRSMLRQMQPPTHA